MLLKRRDIEKDTGVAIRPRNLPGIPQWDWHDFFKWSLMTFEISIGDVFIESSRGISGLFGKKGTFSFGLGTVALSAKWLFNKLLFSPSLVTVLPFSINAGIEEN